MVSQPKIRDSRITVQYLGPNNGWISAAIRPFSGTIEILGTVLEAQSIYEIVGGSNVRIGQSQLNGWRSTMNDGTLKLINCIDGNFNPVPNI